MKEFKSENTKEFFAKLYYNRSAVVSPNQVSAMLRAVICFCKCFKNTDDEVKTLESIFFDPINHVVKNYGDYLSERTKKRLNFKKSLSKLEWIYFRDGQNRTQLNKQYYFDVQHPKFNKILYFEDIVELREWLIIAIDNIFVKVAMREGFSLDFDISAYQVGVKQVEAVTDGYSEMGSKN